MRRFFARPAAVYTVTAAMALTLGSRSLTVPLYGDQLGASRAAVGLLVSSWVLVAGILSLPAGALADRFGARRLLIVALSAFAVSQLASALATGLPVLFATQLLGGVGGAGGQTALLVILTAITPRHRLGRALGWFTLALQLGQLAGPGVAGLLLAFLPLPAVFLVFALPLAAAIGLAALLPQDARPEHRPAAIAPLLEVVRTRRFVALLVAFTAVIGPWGVYQANIAVLAHHSFGLNGTEVGQLLALGAIAGALTRLPAGAVLDRLRSSSTLLICAPAFAIAVCLAILPHARGFLVPALLAVAMAPFLAFGLMATGVRFVELTPAEARGTGLGVYSAANYIGFALGAVLVAPVMDSGYASGFTAAAAGGAVLALAGVALDTGARGVSEPGGGTVTEGASPRP